jgi:hypothetical protein
MDLAWHELAYDRLNWMPYMLHNFNVIDITVSQAVSYWVCWSVSG